MAAPVPVITTYFDFPFNPDAFTLDDPVRGELDNVTYTLYSATPVEVAGDGNSVTIRRGNQSQLFPDVNAGTCVVQLNNEDRAYDPENTAGTYFGNILPGRRVTITCAGVVIFDGRTQDWDFTYEVSKRSVAVMICADGLAALARQELDAFTATASQTPGQRISDVLDRAEVQWPYARALDDGISVLQGDAVTFATNVIAYLNTVTQSEVGGYMFVARDGVLTFKDRHAALNPDPTSIVAFTDDGTGIGYQTIQTQYGDDLLFNRVSVQRAGAAATTVLSIDSQFLYGIRSVTSPSLLLNSAGQALDAANFLAGRYSEPEFRISQLTVELGALSETDQVKVLRLDIASLVSVAFTPNSVGDPIERTCLVLGISHDIGPKKHLVTLDLGSIDRRAVFQLDDTVFGLLDSGSLLAF